MPCFGMRYAVVWYVLCRAGMRYAVVFGMGYAVILGITIFAVWTVSQFGLRLSWIYIPLLAD